MEDYDEQTLCEVDDEELLMGRVICGEHELLYLDCCLREAFRIDC